MTPLRNDESVITVNVLVTDNLFTAAVNLHRLLAIEKYATSLSGSPMSSPSSSSSRKFTKGFCLCCSFRVRLSELDVAHAVLDVAMICWNSWNSKLLALERMAFAKIRILYATNTPERWVKGKFDYLGHGHNLFHMGCIIGALIHIWASLKCFHERQLFSCPETGLYN